MTASLYSATVPHFLRQLPQMVALIDRAEAHCADTGLPEADLLDARLAEDMWPLLLQIRSCWSHSADAVDSALAGIRKVDYTAPPAEFGHLRQKIGDAIDRLRTIDPVRLDAVECGEVDISAGEHRLKFSTADYLVHFALPNFYFHCSIAYAILRNRGVAMGKSDFLGPLPLKARD